MTEVYINQKRVFFKENTSLKLTVENTFFEDSGSYTLDVVFPLDIEQNRIVFGNVNRIEATKRYVTFDAKILVDSKVVFVGTAKITNINDTEVKLQMLSGNSRVKFWTKAEGMYIDEFHYVYTDTDQTFDEYYAQEGFFGKPLIRAGSFPGKRGVYCYVTVKDTGGSEPATASFQHTWNEQVFLISHDDVEAMSHGGTIDNPQFYAEIRRECIQPNLMFVLNWVVEHLGYTIRRNDRDSQYVRDIYIATATQTNTWSAPNYSNSADEDAMAKALPHWTVQEFIEQLQKFLNVKFVFDDINHAVDIIDTIYHDGTIDITDKVEDEYEAEMIDDEDVREMIYDSNLVYKKGSIGSYARPDMVEPETIKAFRLLKFSSVGDIFGSFDAMNAEDKKRTIWEDTTNHRQYCMDASGNLRMFNHFGALIRNEENENSVELKISPVAITTDILLPICEYQVSGGTIYADESMERPKWERPQTVLLLENQYRAANHPSVWDAANGSSDEETQKEDIMQVFFMDGSEMNIGFFTMKYQQPFTDFNLQSGYGNRAYSFSLMRRTSWDIGGFHNSAQEQNVNAEQRFRFRSDNIPSVYSIFMVRNKKYACKKLEVQFDGDGMDEMILGYFEEIL